MALSTLPLVLRPSTHECQCHCFLDDDKAGREAFEKARQEGLLTDADVNFCTCEGMQDAEIEDTFNPAVYQSMILNAYRVTLECPKFNTIRSGRIG